MKTNQILTGLLIVSSAALLTACLRPPLPTHTNGKEHPAPAPLACTPGLNGSNGGQMYTCYNSTNGYKFVPPFFCTEITVAKQWYCSQANSSKPSDCVDSGLTKCRLY